MIFDWVTVPTDMALPKFIALVTKRMKDLATTIRGVNETVFLPGATNPPVDDQARIYKTANAGATNLASFTNGSPGQRFILLAGDAVTTLVHSANLVLKGGVNVALALGNSKQFFSEDGVVFREYPAP